MGDAGPRDAAIAACAFLRDASTCDPRNPTSPDGIPGWTPVGQPELAVWLDGDHVEEAAGSVIGWPDRTGQIVAHSMPGPAPLRSNCTLEGHRAVSFPGVLEIDDTPVLHFGSGDFAIIVVASYSNQPDPTDLNLSYASFFEKKVDDAPFLGAALVANTNLPPVQTTVLAEIGFPSYGAYSTTSSLTGCNDGRPRSYGARFIAPRLEVYTNGVRVGSSSVTTGIDLSLPGHAAFIGGDICNCAKHALDGSLYELLIFLGPVPDQDLHQLHEYLRSKYALY
jgi:hypothetical protein